MKKSLLKIFVVSFALAMTVACGKKGSDGASVNGRDSRVTTSGLVPSGSGSIGGVATLQFTAAQQVTVQENARILVSASMDPQELGTIQSIEVSGNIAVQSGGTISNDSAFQILIRDSYAGQTTSEGTVIEPVIIRISNATGTAYNGVVNVTFSDSFGTITVTGNWVTGGNFTGNISFRNSKGGYNGKLTGTLGSFSLATCSFFRCTQ